MAKKKTAAPKVAPIKKIKAATAPEPKPKKNKNISVDDFLAAQNIDFLCSEVSAQPLALVSLLVASKGEKLNDYSRAELNDMENDLLTGRHQIIHKKG